MAADSDHGSDQTDGGADDVSLTRTLRALSAPGPESVERGDNERRALVLCRDRNARKWAQRWLTQEGLAPHIPADVASCVHTARTLHPAVILVEAGLLDHNREPLYRSLVDAADITAPVIVLCATSRELKAALESDAHDVARKPYEWQSISRRAAHAARLGIAESKADADRQALKSALSVADAARMQLRSRETFEPVTGMPNKAKFRDLLQRAMSAVTRDGNDLAVIVIGFSRFRLVVEAMGQEQADQVLAEIARSLMEMLGDASLLQKNVKGLRSAAAGSLDQYRFAAMLTCVSSDDDFRQFWQRLLDALSQPVEIAGQTVSLSACLGIAIYPQDANDADRLLQRADNAMRDAQSHGGGVRFFCKETDAAAAHKLKLEHLLHEAVHAERLTLAFQPIVASRGERVTAAEVLLRWTRDDGSVISPTEFIPVAEDCGLIIRIGEYVIDKACQQLKDWRTRGFELPRVCINVSRLQLASDGFVAFVRKTLDRHGLGADSLELELSERGVLSGNTDVIARLQKLKSLGVRISVDDFGTGDSAIAYLRDLPIDAIKIDQSYIGGLTGANKDEAITSGIVALAQKLELTVIAEGVETIEQIELLERMNCDEIQGFLISEPLAPADFAQLLQSRRAGVKLASI